MKKKVFLIAVVVLFLAAFSTSAFAGSHHGSRKVAKSSVCRVKNCTKTGSHIHNGKSYSAHYYGDGHTYHDYCEIEGCTLSGYHSHDGKYCFGHTANDGHSYHRGGHH